MSVTYEIVPASIRHVRRMAKTMRAGGAKALEGYGFNPREGLRRVFIASPFARTALIEGRPVAMWGLAAPLMADSAAAWLVLSEEASTLPRAILTEAKAQLAEAAERCSEIMAVILPDDEASLRLARHLGFCGEDNRIPMGDRYFIRMGYRPEARV